MIKLPVEYENRMKKLLGDEYEEYVKAFSQTPVRAFRVNTEKISKDDFENINCFSHTKISYVENGYYFDYDKIGNHPFHHAGMIYVQEPGAMAPAECIEINPDWTILDMCAAPGGKSSQLRNKLNSDSILVSNEIISSRCKTLTGNIERLGFKNTVTTCMDTSKLAKNFPATFDLIMVDAPCSGEGMFRKDENAIAEWSEENIRKCAVRQKEILENAVKCLKNDGYIIYATCTFSLEENEKTIDSFLQEHPEFELVPVRKEVEQSTEPGILFNGCKTDKIHYTRRFYPHKSQGEGQFMAVLHNTLPAFENVYTKKKTTNKPVKIDAIVTEFLDSVLEEYDKNSLRIYNSRPVFFSDRFEIKEGLAFCLGVTIGEVKKNYVLPHHQFFMAMGDKFRRKIELDENSEEIKKYLYGEEFDTDCENGWAVVTVKGCTLGGVKVVSGRAKNHYPKGLRIK